MHRLAIDRRRHLHLLLRYRPQDKPNSRRADFDLVIRHQYDVRYRIPIDRRQIVLAQRIELKPTIDVLYTQVMTTRIWIVQYHHIVETTPNRRHQFLDLVNHGLRLGLKDDDRCTRYPWNIVATRILNRYLCTRSHIFLFL